MAYSSRRTFCPGHKKLLTSKNDKSNIRAIGANRRRTIRCQINPSNDDACKERPRFTFVDGLRGVAALSVVLYHSVVGGHISVLLAGLPAWFSLGLSFGEFGVAVFFALSGFVIAHSTSTVRMTAPCVIRFMLRRSVQLDPPYWVAIGVILMFSAVSAVFVAEKKMMKVSLDQLLAHAFYLQEILGYQQINMVFWTLCQEVQFYLAYVVLLSLSRNDPKAYLHGATTTVAMAASALVSLLWPLGLVKTEPYTGSFLPLWHCFLAGAGAYWAWRHRSITLVFLAFAAIVAFAAMLRGDSFSLVSSVTALALWAVATSDRMGSAFNYRWLRFLGAISYSLYLLHNPITGATFHLGFMLTGRSALWEAVWWVAAMLTSIAAASAMWWLIEQPSIRLAQAIQLDQSLFRSSRPAESRRP